MVAATEQQQIVRYSTDRGEVALSTEIVRRLWCPNASSAEAYTFIQLCRYHHLNPHLKEAYIIKYSEKDPASFIIGKEAWLARAEAHPQYEGFRAGIILKGVDGLEYRPSQFKTADETLLGGWCEVYRKDRREPMRIEVALQEYDRGRSLWNSHKATMIRKVAITQAHREAFPGMFAGLYEQAEISDEGPLNEDLVVESTGTWLPPESVNPDTGEIINDVTAPPKPAPPKPEERLSNDRPARAPLEALRRLNECREQEGVSVEDMEAWIATNFDGATARTLTGGEVNQVVAAILNKSLAGADTVATERHKAINRMFGLAAAYSITQESLEDWSMNTYQLPLAAIGEDHANSIYGAIQTGLLTAPHEPDAEAMADPEPAETPPDQEMSAESEAGNTLPLLPFE